jgi:hypothetical protein
MFVYMLSLCVWFCFILQYDYLGKNKEIIEYKYIILK